MTDLSAKLLGLTTSVMVMFRNSEVLPALRIRDRLAPSLADRCHAGDTCFSMLSSTSDSVVEYRWWLAFSLPASEPGVVRGVYFSKSRNVRSVANRPCRLIQLVMA